MSKFRNLLVIGSFLFFSNCASTCMEYRSATTAARTEKNLKRAEKWGLEALQSAECDPENNSLVPYFLAVEVYKKQKKYTQMAEMLNIAYKRNPNQLLEVPFKIGDSPVKTVGDGVRAFRDQEWVIIYNQAIDLNQKDKIESAMEKIAVATLLHPQKIENYSTLAYWYSEIKNFDLAVATIDSGLIIDPKNSMLYQMKADIAIKNNNLDVAKVLYEKSIQLSIDPGPIMRKLLFVYIDLGNISQAIEYSNELLDKYPNDPDLYYNVGVLYQRLTVQAFESARDMFLKLSEEPDDSDIINTFELFKKAREYAYNSRDYFLQASDLELEEIFSTNDAVLEMRKLMDQIDEIFIPSIREIANSVGIKLE